MGALAGPGTRLCAEQADARAYSQQAGAARCIEAHVLIEIVGVHRHHVANREAAGRRKR